MKTGPVAFILWLCGFVGLCGLHRFYLGRPFTGILWLFTLGLLGIGQLIDLFLLGSMVREANLNRRLDLSHASAQATANNHNVVAPVINISIPGSHFAPAAAEAPVKTIQG